MTNPSSGIWPPGYGLAAYAELDSTNAEARRLAEAGAANLSEKSPLWIIAARQSAGRGRRGRVWESPPGNLAASLLIHPARPLAEWAQLSFAAAVATADMAAMLAPEARIAVKWPNDVLGDGRKLAGILLETAGPALIIGIGVNLAAHPEGTEFPATSLLALGSRAAIPEDALALLAQGFARWYEVWRIDGFAPIRDAWLARAAGLGQRIRARLPDSERVGVFEGIDADGALLLNAAGRTTAIAAGEVFFG